MKAGERVHEDGAGAEDAGDGDLREGPHHQGWHLHQAVRHHGWSGESDPHYLFLAKIRIEIQFHLAKYCRKGWIRICAKWYRLLIQDRSCQREKRSKIVFFLFKCLLHVPGEGGDEEGEEKAAGAAPEDQAEPGQPG